MRDFIGGLRDYVTLSEQRPDEIYKPLLIRAHGLTGIVLVKQSTIFHFFIPHKQSLWRRGNHF